VYFVDSLFAAHLSSSLIMNVPTKILTDSARKRNRKEVLANYNKTRIKIGHQHDRWMVLKEVLRV
jgi:hypothetical protein